MTTDQILTEPSTEAAARFAALIGDSYQSVYNMAYRLAGNRQDAEDVTQEACFRAFRSMDRFEGNRPLTNWMGRIVTRLYLDLLRHRRRRVSEVSMDSPLGGFPDSLIRFDPEDPRPTPEQALLNDVFNEDLADALTHLSPEQRELVKMVDEDGLDLVSIAANLSLPRCTVGSRLHRAHRQLRARLTAQSTSPKPSTSRKQRAWIAISMPPSRSSFDWTRWSTAPLSHLAAQFT